MSNQMSNAPMMSAGPTSIFQTWINALTKPNEQTYARYRGFAECQGHNRLFMGFY